MKKKILILSAILVALTTGGITMAAQPTKQAKAPKASQALIHEFPAITITPSASVTPAVEVPVDTTTPTQSSTMTPTTPAPSLAPPTSPAPADTPPAEPQPLPVFTITPGTP